MSQSIRELHDSLLNVEAQSEVLVSDAIKRAKEINSKYNAFVTILDEAKGVTGNDELVSGIPFAVKDNLATKDILTTGSSNTLKDYVPVYTATVVQNLLDKGAVMIGKTVMDEFGMGGTGTTGHTGVVRNPWNKDKSCAGSSAGSACAVASGVVP